MNKILGGIRFWESNLSLTVESLYPQKCCWSLLLDSNLACSTGDQCWPPSETIVGFRYQASYHFVTGMLVLAFFALPVDHAYMFDVWSSSLPLWPDVWSPSLSNEQNWNCQNSSFSVPKVKDSLETSQVCKWCRFWSMLDLFRSAKVVVWERGFYQRLPLKKKDCREKENNWKYLRASGTACPWFWAPPVSSRKSHFPFLFSCSRVFSVSLFSLFSQ